jgi:hypothetical protein
LLLQSFLKFQVGALLSSGSQISNMLSTIVTMSCVMLSLSEALFLSSSFSNLAMINRRTALTSPLAAFLSVAGKYDDMVYGVFDEGYVPVTRGDATFSLYYRIYNASSPMTPLVVCHGGP